MNERKKFCSHFLRKSVIMNIYEHISKCGYESLDNYVDDVEWTTNIGFEVVIFNLYEIEQNSRILCVNLALHF